MANIITIELCAEDRARLDRLTAFLEERIAQVDELYSKTLPGQAAETDGAKTAATEQEPTPKEEPATEPSKAPTEATAPQVTVEDIRSKYMGLATTPKKKEAVTLLKLYADKISDIPADKLGEVLEKLNELEG